MQTEVEGEGRLCARFGARERGFDRLSRAAEDGEDTVAQELALDRGALVLADDGAERAVQITRPTRGRWRRRSAR